jgi:hypothetical protein
MATGSRAFAKKKAHRLEKLRAVHRALDKQIKTDYNKYQDVQGKKVEKMKLKEEIVSLESQLGEQPNG